METLEKTDNNLADYNKKVEQFAQEIFEAWKNGGEEAGRIVWQKIRENCEIPLYAIFDILREFRELTQQ
jgi:hypothetical protein